MASEANKESVGSVPMDPAIVAEDPNLIRVYGVGEFQVFFEASPAAAADLVVELHKRGVAIEALPEGVSVATPAPEAES